MTVYKDKDRGTWYCEGRYKNSVGDVVRYKKRGFQTKKEATEYERKLQLDATDHSSSPSMEEAYNELMQYSVGMKKATTIRRDKIYYDLYIGKAFGKKKLNKITPKDLVKFRTSLLEKELSKLYINDIFKTMNKIYNYINKMYGLQYNPVRLVGKLKEDKREYKTWDIDSYNQFMKVIENPKHRCAFRVLYFTGMRRGELLALQWKDYHDGLLSITKGCNFEKGGYSITTPKTDNSIRDVQLDRTTCMIIDEYHDKCKNYDGFNEEWFIFGDYKPLSFNALSEAKNKYEKISGVEHIRIHDFRHSHVSLLINNNIPLPAIAHRVGDSIETIINTYSHLFATSNDKLMNFLEDIK